MSPGRGTAMCCCDLQAWDGPGDVPLFFWDSEELQGHVPWGAGQCGAGVMPPWGTGQCGAEAMPPWGTGQQGLTGVQLACGMKRTKVMPP